MNLLRELTELLLRMRMLSEGRTSSFSEGGTSSDPDYTPRLSGGSLYEDYAGEDGELTRLVYRMQRDVRRATHAGRKPEIKEDRDKRIIKDYEGWPSRRVAVEEGLSHTTICQIRKRHGRAADDGSRDKAA